VLARTHRRTHRRRQVALLLLVALAATTALLARPVTISGQLWQDRQGEFVLASGDLITLTPAAHLDLGAYVGRKVTVTGTWSTDRRFLRVWRVELA
jgi:hypothetical protein